MKSSSVRGTPIRHITNTAQEGVSPRTPKGMSGTVNKQFEGDQKINREEGISTGTPYTSKAGNSDEFKRTVSRDKYGKVIGEAGDNQNPRDNGNGVLLDGMTRESGYTPHREHTLDSPVPDGSPAFDTHTIREENRAHLGKGIGVSEAQINDDLLGIEGVMSRGLDNTEDDVNERPDEGSKPFGFKTTKEDQQQRDDDRG